MLRKLKELRIKELMNTENLDRTEASQLDEEGISLLDFFYAIKRFKYSILALSLTSTLIALIYAITVTPIYRAEVLVSSQLGEDYSSGSSSLSGLASLAGVNIGSGGNKAAATALATLKSRSFLIRYIQDSNLQPLLFPEIWDQESNKWEGAKQPSMEKSFSRISRMINIRKKESGLMTFSVESTDPKLAANLANDIIFVVNNYIRKQVIDESSESIEFLKKELAVTNLVGIQKSISNVIEGHTQTKTLANVRQQYAFKVIDPAVVPENRISPNRRLITMLGFVIGAMIGIFYAILRDLFQIREKIE